MLKTIALSAPHWVKHGGFQTQKSLNSTDPFSLQNALRLAAWNAQQKIGYWGHSNWSNRSELKKSIRLMNYCEDELQSYIDLISEEKPNLLFIGAMTLSYPGAIVLAKCAKEILKEKVFIVLGGKHCIETFWNKGEEFFHHNGSPLKNMAIKNNLDDKVFDLVISGDGEEVIVQIGEVIGELLQKNDNLNQFYSHIEKLKLAKGNWIAGWVDDNFSIHHLKGLDLPLDYNTMPVPAEVFGITANFPVFEADVTGHAYSDMSKGCVYDCFFCSERNSINGKIKQKDSAPIRLYKQFQKICEVGKSENKAKVISAFVEDSVILSGNKKLLDEFNQLLSENPLEIKWGCQFTIDGFLEPEIVEIITKLRANGLQYVLFGMETISENIALKMSKNSHKEINWKTRNELVLELIERLGMKAGFCILWGLGENQTDRLKHLKTLKEWQHKYGEPSIISLNWAVRHPMRSLDIIEPTYLEWGTSKKSKHLDTFIELFGEASEKYNLPDVESLSVDEMNELKDLYYDIIYNKVELNI